MDSFNCRTSKMSQVCGLVLLSLVGATLGQEIFFPTHKVYRKNDPCTTKDGSSGICLLANECPQLDQVLRSAGSIREHACPPFSDNIFCCPKSQKIVRANLLDITKPKDVSRSCGNRWVHTDQDLLTYYRINETARQMQKDGLQISDEHVGGDFMYDFRASNATFNMTYTEIFGFVRAAVGGEPARAALITYMALIGDKDGSTNNWFCDGVLINWQWILTAAHCFRKTPTVVRLGEYSLATTTPSSSEDPQDYGIRETHIYPDYRFPGTDHDLALIKIDKPTYISRYDINPICLPWGDQSLKSHIGNEVTLTGWGATFFGGTFTDILQEVNVTVFDPSVCDRSYSNLRDYKRKFPNGITSKTHICAGDQLGGKDACQGDSGGPIVYLQDEYTYTLAGIVSAGHGCGLKDFPGLYVPLNNPKYLSWIKKVAFN